MAAAHRVVTMPPPSDLHQYSQYYLGQQRQTTSAPPPESSALLDQLDRAIRSERAQAMERIERTSQDVDRARAVIGAATKRAEEAECRAAAAEQSAAAMSMRAHSAEARALAIENELATARAEWARERQELTANAVSKTDLAATVAQVVRRLELDDPPVSADLVNAAQRLLTLTQSRRAQQQDPRMSRAHSTTSSSRRGLPLDNAIQHHPQPMMASSSRPSSEPSEAVPANTGDEMERLLLKYQQAKEKLKALEQMYPGC